MTTLSPQQISKFLQRYSTDVESWSPTIGETGITFGVRRDLHDVLGKLTAAQRTSLDRADATVKALFAKHQGHADPHMDIAFLGDIVRIIDSERSTAAA